MRTSKLRCVEGFTREIPFYMSLADFFIGKPGPNSVSEALACGLPVIVVCNSWTLPQERYNAEWVAEKRFGIVLRSFAGINRAVSHLLAPGAIFRGNVAQYTNRAVFEVVDILQEIMEQSRAPVADPDDASLGNPLADRRLV